MSLKQYENRLQLFFFLFEMHFWPTIHPSTYSSTHPMHPFMYSPTQPCTHPPICALTHPSTHPYTHLPTHQSTHLPIYSPTHLFIHTPIHVLTHPLTSALSEPSTALDKALCTENQSVDSLLKQSSFRIPIPSPMCMSLESYRRESQISFYKIGSSYVSCRESESIGSIGQGWT